MQNQNNLSNAQLELLNMFKRPLAEEDLKAIKRLITAYLAEKLNKVADKNWEEKSWTEEDMKRLLDAHLRTPYNNK
ncbi:MAG: hypothetical protein COZ18_06175 [Flexibacter sp. CG_4_10_14_3_um_filter_32_15]|nr:MAG: hypothetical protein COZ18_06175 [Flexibacter sp. CG_4_10_14_3_um_filter_32_15]